MCPISLPTVHDRRNFMAVRALRWTAGSEDAASRRMDETKPSVFTHREEIKSVADLLMLGFGEVASVLSTLRDSAGKMC